MPHQFHDRYIRRHHNKCTPSPPNSNHRRHSCKSLRYFGHRTCRHFPTDKFLTIGSCWMIKDGCNPTHNLTWTHNCSGRMTDAAYSIASVTILILSTATIASIIAALGMVVLHVTNVVPTHLIVAGNHAFQSKGNGPCL